MTQAEGHIGCSLKGFAAQNAGAALTMVKPNKLLFHFSAAIRTNLLSHIELLLSDALHSHLFPEIPKRLVILLLGNGVALQKQIQCVLLAAEQFFFLLFLQQCPYFHHLELYCNFRKHL